MTRIFDKARLHQLCLLGTICAVLLCLGCEAQTGAPQTAALPVTTTNAPNLAPDPFTNWRSMRVDGDDFLPPHAGPGPVRSDPAQPYRPNDLDGQQDAASNPNYRLADLTNPILTPWAKEKMKVWNDMVLAGETIPFEAQERCYPPSTPSWHIFRRVGGTMLYFVQTPKVTWMIWRGDNQVRRIYMDVPHSANPKPSWFGESVGHWEGNTLVVDTIAMLDHPLSFVDNYRTPHSKDLHVVERFKMVDNDTIDVEITVEDPVAFTMPWTARQVWYRSNSNRALEEAVCAEMGLSPGAEYFGLQAVSIPQTVKPDF